MHWLSNGYACTRARAVAIACGLLLGAGAAGAQNVRIENVTVAPRDARTATVRFDVSWANSWRHEANHDAAWVFFKVRAEGGRDWQHVRLAADKVLNPTGYGQGKDGTPLDFIVPDGDDGFTGMFVRRAEYAAPGKLAARNVTAVWDFTANKGTTKDLKGVSIRAFGIEMVYVAEGPFYLGPGGTELNGFYRYTDGSQHTLPYRVTSAGAIPTGRQKGRLWARKGAQPEDGGEIPASFPNGYAAFYCAKDTIRAAQYAAFLNTLSAAEADKRYSERAVARSGASPNYTYSGANVEATRGLSWADCAALAAWAGLRPVTELECEKAVRGPCEPVPDFVGPSYWNIPVPHWFWDSLLHDGVAEWRVVTVGNAAGRRFRGTHGDGTPTLPADWPQDDAVGTGIRTDGRSTAAGTRLSDRLHAAAAEPEWTACCRWRGVRTAPSGVGP